jgi:hypothetical protein
MTEQQLDATLPTTIEDSETIVRVVKAPAHFKNGKVATAVFRPRPGKSDISVMRQRMGDDFCKRKGVEISKPPTTYVGLMAIAAGSIRSVGSCTVRDSRDVWPGHADLDHGFTSVKDEPASKAEFTRMTEACQALRKASTFHEDKEPTADTWTGQPLKLG